MHDEPSTFLRVAWALLRVLFVIKLLVLVSGWLDGPGVLPDWIRPNDWITAHDALSMVGEGYQPDHWPFFWLLPIVAALLRALSWFILARGLDARVSFVQSVRVWFAAHSVGFFFPSTLGVDAYRVLCSRRGTRASATATVVADRIVGVLALALTAVPFGIAIYVGLEESPAKLRSGLLVCAVAAGAGSALALLYRPRALQTLLEVLPLPERVRCWLMEVVEAFHLLTRSVWRLPLAIFFAMVSNTLIVAAIADMLSIWRRDFDDTLSFALATPALVYPWLFDFTAVKGLVSENVLESLTLFRSEAAGLAVCTLFLWNYTRVDPAVYGALVIMFTGLPRLTLRVEAPASSRSSAPAVRELRKQLGLSIVAAGGGGLLAGACVGLAESAWLYRFMLSDSPELRMFWWAPMAYGAAFALAGLGLGGAVWLVGLLAGQCRRPGGVLALSLGLWSAVALVVIGRFRIVREVLGEHPLSLPQILILLVTAGVVALVLERLVSAFPLRTSLRGVRGALVVVALFLALVALGAGFAARAASPPAAAVFAPKPGLQSPNVFFVVIDTLRADYLKVYNPASSARTPHFDAFARDAVRFEHSFSQASWTKPSFATMFTGVYPSQHGAIGKSDLLPASATTMAEYFRDAGYYTQGQPNNSHLLPAYGLSQGFLRYEPFVNDYYFGGSPSVDHLAIYQVLRRMRVLAMYPRIDIGHFYQPAPIVRSHALQWLDQRPFSASAPFLLYCHFMDPHDPYMAGPDRTHGFSAIMLGMNPDPARWLNDIVRAYRDEVEYVDAAIGELMSGLKERGLYDDALIVVTSDHGEELQEHGGWSHGPTLFDEVTHVPILIKLPGNAGGGTVNPYLARHVDLLPTLLARAGLPVPAELPGVPLVDAQGGALNAATEHSYAEADFLEQVSQSVRTRDAKFLWTNSGNPKGIAPRLLFDLDKDPGEVSSIAGHGDPREAALEAALEDHLKATGGKRP